MINKLKELIFKSDFILTSDGYIPLIGWIKIINQHAFELENHSGVIKKYKFSEIEQIGRGVIKLHSDSNEIYFVKYISA